MLPELPESELVEADGIANDIINFCAASDNEGQPEAIKLEIRAVFEGAMQYRSEREYLKKFRDTGLKDLNSEQRERSGAMKLLAFKRAKPAE